MHSMQSHSHCDGRRSQHAASAAAVVHSARSSSSVSAWSWGGQVRWRATVVPGNGSKRKGEPADGNYKLSEVGLHSCVSTVAS